MTHSYWWGTSNREQEYGVNFTARMVDREDYFHVRSTKNNLKFMLKFKWYHQVDFVASDVEHYGVNYEESDDDDDDVQEYVCGTRFNIEDYDPFSCYKK